MKKTVVFDFDGVIHSYTSGWKGTTVIPDPPVSGIVGAIDDLRHAGYEIAVVSTRTATPEGRKAVFDWLMEHNIIVDKICSEKPPAYIYIDDRAICFDGDAKTLLSKIDNFKTWMESPPETVSIVRCKECIHSKLLGDTPLIKENPWKYYRSDCRICRCHDLIGDEFLLVEDDFFCKYGKRKETKDAGD